MDVIPDTIHHLTIVVRELDCFNTLNWRQIQWKLKKFTELRELKFRLCKGGDPFRSKEVGESVMRDVYGALPGLREMGFKEGENVFGY